ncbi:LAETG motif-containing sortase-dependent surface protein [Streptomyces formicae]
MKLRRAMAATAATAAIVPIALLSAPAAFATGDTTTVSPTETATETAKPTETPKPTDKPTETPKPTDKPTETTKPTDKPTETAKPTDKPTEKPTDKPTAKPTEEPTEPPTDCPVDEDGEDVDSKLEMSINGLPGKIVAGSGWHQFELRAANPTDEELGEVQWIAAVDSDGADEEDWLSNYANLQYFDPETKSWESIDGDLDGGLAFGVTELGAKEKVDIKLRLKVSAKAPAGPGYAIGLGGYVDSEANCVRNSFDYYPLTILKAGSDNDDPGTAKPKPGKHLPTNVTKPQGGAKDLPVTGSLAETGSSSMLPTIGIAGGIAVVAGAGAVFVVRRRKADAAA